MENEIKIITVTDLELLTHKIAKIKCELDCTVDQALAIVKYNQECGGSI